MKIFAMSKFRIALMCFIILSSYSFSYSQSDKLFSKKAPNIIQGNKEKITPDVIGAHYDLRRSLPKGYVDDGSVDYTKYIQKGIDENSNVLMPNFPILINDGGLSIRSNSNIAFQDKSSIILKSSSKGSYALLNVSNVENVIIKNPVIVGDRDSHIGKTGEWGMGIQISESQNIRIISAIISNCWGDGIYIGSSTSQKNDHIEINSVKIDNCRRNGISITHGSNIEILNAVISNTNGVAPMAGIDIEPNNGMAAIDNIKIINPTTINNGNFGIVVSLGALPSEVSKNVKIRIDNHIDNGSKIAFCLAGFRGNYQDKKILTGLIEVNNPKWNNNKTTLLANKYYLGPMTKFKNVQIYKKQRQSNEELQKIKQDFKLYGNINIE